MLSETGTPPRETALRTHTSGQQTRLMHLEYVKCPGKMPACTRALVRLIFLSIVLQNGQEVFSTTVICARRFYPIDNACKLCPAHCNVCTNATQCSLCQMGYYGPVCQNTCEVGCSGTCHKLYGHCTYGCPDGKYADDKSPACLNCYSQCKVCSSLTSCVECHSGYYGNTCMKRCSEHCKEGLCNSTDGTCFECEKGSYKMDTECLLCPDGCANCSNSHTCTVCNSGFIGPIHGRCLLDCPTMNGDEQESICHQGLCRNLPAYWKLPLDACNHAHSSDCVTEGLCVVLKSGQLTLERTSSDNLEHSLLYMHFKCSFECIEHATLNSTDPCKGHVCRGLCVLDKPLSSDTYVIASDYSIGDTPPLGTSINSHCTLGSAKDGIDNSSTNPAIAITLVIVSVCVVAGFIVLFLWCLKKKKKKNKASKEKSSNEIELSESIRMPLENSTHSINSNTTHSSHKGFMRSNSSVADNPNQTTHLLDREVRLLRFSSTERIPSRQTLNYSDIEKFPPTVSLTKAETPLVHTSFPENNHCVTNSAFGRGTSQTKFDTMTPRNYTSEMKYENKYQVKMSPENEGSGQGYASLSATTQTAPRQPNIPACRVINNAMAAKCYADQIERFINHY